jgi:uncharacterized protein with GYD domain
MARYVTLWKYTKDGLVDIKKTPERYKAVQEIVKSSGGELLQTCGLVGAYDVLTIMEMPDEKVLTSAIFKICSKGRVIPQTMTAIPIEEFLELAKNA